MGQPIPRLSYEGFSERLRSYLCLPPRPPPKLNDATLQSLYSHYQEMRVWNTRLSLIGPGTVEGAVERHYGESLLGLGLLEQEDRSLLDLGSGAGFPGLVLAAARPSLDVYLVDSRQRKCAFLQSVTRRSALSCRCLNARISNPLPEDFPKGMDVITSRAVRVEPELLGAFFDSLPRVRCLLWQGEGELDLPTGARIRRRLEIPRSRRTILEVIGPEFEPDGA